MKKIITISLMIILTSFIVASGGEQESCSLGSSRCNGDNLQKCNYRGMANTQWETIETCPNGCKDNACIADNQESCLKGSFRCDGDIIQRCGSTGMAIARWGWDDIEDCSDKGLICLSGACTYKNEIPENSCKETDGGKNIYKSGKITGYESYSSYYDSTNDFCNIRDILTEFYCSNDKPSTVKYDEIECPYGCENGACIEFIEDEEEIEVTEEEPKSSINCPTKSCKTISKDCYGKDEIIIEECKVYIKKDNQCEEVTTSNSKINMNECNVEERIECTGCQLNQNTCIPFGTRIEKENNEYYCSVEHKMLQQKNNGESCQNTYECISNNCMGSACAPICTGCLDANNICIPFGTRTDTQYCDIDFSFKNQKSEDMGCNNNYECSTNICVDSNCISPNLIQKIIFWFKNIFE